MGAATFIILGLIVASIGLGLWTIRRDVAPVWRFVPPTDLPSGGPPKYKTVFTYDVITGQAHAPALVTTDEGFELLWFEGSAEAQADVDIHFARFERTGTEWREIARGTRVTRCNLGAAMDPDQLVVTLGNTVQNANARGHIYATVVSVGGWAMASVAEVALKATGPLIARKLNLSPFLNRSNLVKSPMVAFADGSHGLPAYFEMGTAYGLLARFDSDGHVRDAVRMQGVGKPIQPMIVPLDATRAVAFLRDFDPSHRLLMSRSENGGQSWSQVTAMDMSNPSAPVAALALGKGRILMVGNDVPGGSDRLSLLLSEDEGENWRVLSVLEDNGAGARYPMLYVMPQGEILLTYSIGNKRGIRVQSLSPAWVAAQ